MKKMKIFSIIMVLSIILLGCVSRDSTVEDEKKYEYKDVINESNVKIKKENIRLIQDTNNNGIFDDREDIEENTLDSIPMAINYNIQDNDGNGIIKDEEEYKINFQIKNESNNIMKIDDFNYFLQGGTSTVVESIDTNSNTDTSKIDISNKLNSQNVLVYNQTSEDDIIELGAGESITINTKQVASDIIKNSDRTLFSFSAKLYMGEEVEYVISYTIDVENANE